MSGKATREDFHCECQRLPLVSREKAWRTHDCCPSTHPFVANGFAIFRVIFTKKCYRRKKLFVPGKMYAKGRSMPGPLSMAKLALNSLLVFLACLTTTGSAQTLEETFRNPPDQTRPWCYWYWISDNISKEGVTKDLEAMARVGIGTALIGNQWFEDQPQGPVPVLSDEWSDITVHAIREGKRLGVDIGLFNCPGWSMSGGPWVKPEQSMRYLASSEQRVSGPLRFSQTLPAPGADFQDVALLAIPVPPGEDQKLSAREPSVTCSPENTDGKNLVDGDRNTGLNLPRLSRKQPLQVEISVAEAFTARSVTLVPGDGDFRTQVEIQAWLGGKYQTIRKGKYDRRNKKTNVGPMPDGDVVFSIPPTTTDRFRLIFSGREGGKDIGSISEVEISSAARVEYFVEKQLGKMFPQPLPLWGDYLWPAAPDPEATEFAVAPEQVLDFTGKEAFDLPAGEWIVQRIGMLSTGVENSPAAPNGTGLEVDKLNRRHVRPHFDAFVGKLLQRLSAEERKTLKYIVGDSYEKGSQNWTDDLQDKFKLAYGYDPVPYLPTLGGRVIKTAEASDRFLWDLRRLVADLVADEYVAGLRELCNENNMQLWLENYGHWGFPSEFMRYGGQCDQVAGEFWVTGSLGNIECRAAASTAHAYGKPMVYAEAFTSGQNWQYAPFDLKRRGDWAFTEGINHFVLHLYIQQPDDTAPGMTAWFGTEFNRHNTWFDEGRDWLDYLRRCHVMLQQGLHVADFAYFIGEDAPIMTGTRQPMQPAGYDFDFVNGEVITQRMSIKDGRWTLPDGKSYSVLVLPPLKTMRPAVITKLRDLVAAGGVLYGELPERSPSLKNAEEADQIVERLAAEISSGDFRFFASGDLQDVMNELEIGPDLSGIDPGDTLWIHRQTPEMDVYFVSNQKNESVDLQPVFRVPADREPEFWYADTGKIERMGKFSAVDHGIEVPLSLDPYGSVFVVFRKPSLAADLPRKTQSVGVKSEKSLNENTWTLSFQPGRDVPEQIKLDRLAMWTESDDKAIEHYSGTAKYRTEFELTTDWQASAGERTVLDLGKVAPMARVTLNGKDLGLLWKPPYRMDVTDNLVAGKNTLEIAVTNLWANRMLGELKYPDGFADSEGNNTFHPKSSIKSRGLDKRTVTPSGLSGPVRIEQQMHEPLTQAKK